MAYDIALPNITATDEIGKIVQLQCYLYQMVEQLNFALNTLDKEQDNVSKQIITVAKTGGETDNLEKQQNTFNSIKALIIKSADIINSYSEIIEQKISGNYVAKSDFGDYQAIMENRLQATADGILQQYTELQQILNSIQDATNETTGYIRTGKLYVDENGQAVYGVEVGQTNTENGVETFNKFARFVANGIEFYANANDEAPTASLKDSTLVVINAHILGNLNLGRYVLDTSFGGLTFKWIG